MRLIQWQWGRGEGERFLPIPFSEQEAHRNERHDGPPPHVGGYDSSWLLIGWACLAEFLLRFHQAEATLRRESLRSLRVKLNEPL